MHCDWSSRVLYNSTRHAAYVWCVPYNSTYARKPSQSFLSLKILRRFFQTVIIAEEFPSFDLGFDFLNDQNNAETATDQKKKVCRCDGNGEKSAFVGSSVQRNVI